MLEEQLSRYRRVLYYAGAQTNVVNGPEWQTDQWIKSHYKLQLIESRTVEGLWIAYFEMSTKTADRHGDVRTGSGRERYRG